MAPGFRKGSRSCPSKHLTETGCPQDRLDLAMAGTVGVAEGDGELREKQDGRKGPPLGSRAWRPLPPGDPQLWPSQHAQLGVQVLPLPSPKARRGKQGCHRGTPWRGPLSQPRPGQVVRPAVSQHPMTSCHHRGIPSPYAANLITSQQAARQQGWGAAAGSVGLGSQKSQQTPG